MQQVVDVTINKNGIRAMVGERVRLARLLAAQVRAQHQVRDTRALDSDPRAGGSRRDVLTIIIRYLSRIASKYFTAYIIE